MINVIESCMSYDCDGHSKVPVGQDASGNAVGGSKLRQVIPPRWVACGWVEWPFRW